MREAIIQRTKYLQIPDELDKIVPESNLIEKLSLQHIYNGKIQFHAKHWQNLQLIEIIDCSYLEFSFYFPSPGKLLQLYISQCDSLDIGEILGYLPNFSALRIDTSKFIKFKGEIKGEIGLQQIEFDHVLRSEIFQNSVNLPYLEIISWENKCNFFKIDFSKLNAPNLRKISFKDSNYLNFKSLGEIPRQLSSFRFDNCAYPKLNIDFKDLTNLTTKKDEEPTSRVFRPDFFRSIKKSALKKQRSVKNPFRDPNAPDIQLIRNTPDIVTATQKAENFLVDQANFRKKELSSDFKFCPECGTKNPVSAVFCSNCGVQMR